MELIGRYFFLAEWKKITFLKADVFIQQLTETLELLSQLFLIRVPENFHVFAQVTVLFQKIGDGGNGLIKINACLWKNRLFLDPEMSFQRSFEKFQNKLGLPGKIMGPLMKQSRSPLLEPGGKEQPVVMLPGKRDESCVASYFAFPSLLLPGATSDVTMDADIRKKMVKRDTRIEIGTQCSMSILIPMKASTTDNPYLRNRNFLIKPETTK